MENKVKFHDKDWFMWLMLVFFAPIGIYKMWRRNKFTKKSRYVISAIFSLWFIFIVVKSQPTEEEVAEKEAKQEQAQQDREEKKIIKDEEKEDKKKVKAEAEKEENKQKELAEQKKKDEEKPKPKKKAAAKEKEVEEDDEITWDDLKDSNNIVGNSDKDFKELTKSKPSDVRNDVTGNWKVVTMSQGVDIIEYALSYQDLHMKEDEVHFIVNFNYNTTTWLNYMGGLLYVETRERVDKEEHDANKLGTGMTLKNYRIYPDGDIEEIEQE